VRFDVGIRHAGRVEVLENWEGQRCTIICCEPKKPGHDSLHFRRTGRPQCHRGGGLAELRNCPRL
jgi:hypothetical protein